MNIRCIVIDDEPLALQQIRSYVEKIPYLELVRACSGPTEAMEVMKSGAKVDAIFTDIEMPDINGLDYIRSMNDRPIIVFVTAYPNFALEGFQVDATDYLLKPFGLADFMKTAEKVKQIFELRNSTAGFPDSLIDNPVVPIQPKQDPGDIPSIPSAAPRTEQEVAKPNKGPRMDGEYIFVRADSRTVRLKISDIQYIESRKEYVVIFSENSVPIMTLFSLKAMEERLPSDTFMRVHRSFIVNLTKVTEINQNRIVFGENTFVPIGYQYKDAFQQFLAKHFWKG